ncbi:MAG: hypothetical protein IJ365_06820 [Clostridia bacterium]|nr:hypothetical protein [Clostridia bacterium]
MNSFEVTQLVTLTANFLACNSTDEQLSLLATVFSQLGDTLATIEAVKDINSAGCTE